MNLRAALFLVLAWSGPASAEPPPAAAPKTPEQSPSETPPQSGTSEAPEPVPPGAVRVIHLTDVEKERIREQIREEVLAKAQAEGWAQPGLVPDWLKRMEIGGDVRMRYELDAFDSGNSPLFIDFQTINSGPPFDVNGSDLPFLNTTQDRRRARLRARVGIAADISSRVHGGLRLATGSAGNPVSADQTLGSEFEGLSLFLDQAFIHYTPVDSLGMSVGRFANPFVSTELVWDADLNFDGVSARYSLLDAFLTVGAFAVGNTPFAFPSTRERQFASRDKWLYGAQLGTTFGLPGGTATLASTYYYYDDIEGQLSSPCMMQTETDPCDTDHSRPGFIQKGNTLFAIRNVDVGSTNEFQYVGLAAAFRELSVTVRLDFAIAGPLHVLLDAEGVTNLAYDASEVGARNANNFARQTCDINRQNCQPPDPPHEGGNIGYLAQLLFGHPEAERRGDWNVTTSFRRLETDAVVDAFTDSDFHLGGTNAKGFTLGGSMGIAYHSWIALRWLSATEVSSQPLANDVYQVDLNARF